MKKRIPFATSSAVAFSLMSVVVYENTHASVGQYAAQTGVIPSPSVSPSASPTVLPISEQLNDVVALNIIHHTNALEIEENETALSRLQTPGAQQIAQTFVTDHQTSDQQLFTFSGTSDIPIYVFEPSTFEGAADSQLSFLPNSDYDAAYLQLQLQGHQRALANLQMIAAQTLDPALQPIVTAAIAMVQTHIGLITAVQGGQVPTPSPSPSASVSPSPTPSASASGTSGSSTSS